MRGDDNCALFSAGAYLLGVMPPELIQVTGFSPVLVQFQTL